MQPTMRVLISGAGIAGPTLAWFLAKAGAQVTVFEKSHALLPHGQSIDFTGSAITIIKKMGLLDEVRRLNTTEKGSQFIDPQGRPFAPFPLNGGAGASPTNEFEILRGDLAKLLHDATKNDANVIYRLGTTVKKVISNDDSTVQVETSHGEMQEFDFLVAADGQWSKMRKQCFAPESVQMVDKGMNVAYWTVPRSPSDNDWWNIYMAGRSRTIGLRPDPHGTTRAMFSIMPCNDNQARAWQEASVGGRKLQQELLRREFADAGWQARRLLDAMDQAPDFYFHPLHQIKMAKWSTNRVICLGDTAFAPTPLTGMGTSLAIIGAYCLAGELSKLSNAQHPSEAFEAYESVLRPFVEEVQNIPPFVPGIAHPEQEWKRWVFHTCIAAVSWIVRTPWIMNRIPVKRDDEFPLPSYPVFDDDALRKLGVVSSP
ncbi:MAG: hypothetical protein Q9212_005480 [Teloschistes hypoglaucus]